MCTLASSRWPTMPMASRMLSCASSEKFLRQHVQHFAVFRQRDAPRRLDGAAHIVALNVARARPKVMPPRLFTPRTWPPATPTSADSTGTPTIVSASSTARRIELTARSRFTICPLRQPFDSAAPSAANFTAAVVVLLADQGARLRAADIERHNVAFLFCQAVAPCKDSVSLFCRDAFPARSSPATASVKFAAG